MGDQAMLDLTRRLIAIQTENPPGAHYDECAQVLRDELEKLRFEDFSHGPNEFVGIATSASAR